MNEKKIIEVKKITYKPQNKRKARIKKYVGISIFLFILFNPIPILCIPLKNKTEMENPMQLKGWGTLNHTKYTDKMKEEMNSFQFTLYINDIKFNNLTTQKEFLETELTYWKINYPNIRFVIMVIPVTIELYVWDVNSKSVIYQGKMLLSYLTSKNFTNVIGIGFDFECPVKFGGNHIIWTFPNRDIHKEAVSAWNDFFIWKKSANISYSLIAIGFYFLGFDLYTSLNLTHYIDNTPFLEVNRNGWDEIGVMVYRDETRSFKTSSQFLFTLKLSVFRNGIKLSENNLSRINAFIGVAHLNAYSSIEEIANDIIICKAMGINQITIFQMIERGGLAGLFDTFGENALTEINQTLSSKTYIYLPICNLFVSTIITFFPLLFVGIYIVYRLCIIIIPVILFLAFRVKKIKNQKQLPKETAITRVVPCKIIKEPK